MSATKLTTMDVDVLIIGTGIMGATMAARLQEKHPSWKLALLERANQPAKESTGAWHNAGTGHAALCELNYTPLNEKGDVEVSKALVVNAQWRETLETWQRWEEAGKLKPGFLSDTPHLSLVHGTAGVVFLKKRYEALTSHPSFAHLEFTEDPEVIASWAPLLMEGRDASEPMAATRSLEGKDVDFGRLTENLLESIESPIVYGAEVTSLRKDNGRWRAFAKTNEGMLAVAADRVFVAAGGATLPLLQQASMKEIRGYGGFPIAGKFWATSKPELVAKHKVKVYGQAAVGAPPMSVPHLDARMIEGHASLLFGPFAGFSTKFLRHGSLFDLFKSLRWHNLLPMLSVAFANFSLVQYLVGEVFASKDKKLAALQEFFPAAEAKDWHEVTAGQRVQIIKPKGRFRGSLEFGTEVVVSADGTLAGMLGASPGASTAVTTVNETLQRGFC